MASLPVESKYSDNTADELKTALDKKSSHTSEKLFETPISTLQEYCRKLGKTPQYDLTALEGKGHQPLFVYRCMVGDIAATGKFYLILRIWFSAILYFIYDLLRATVVPVLDLSRSFSSFKTIGTKGG